MRVCNRDRHPPQKNYPKAKSRGKEAANCPRGAKHFFTTYPGWAADAG